MSVQSAGTPLAIPDDPEALTSEWLTMALRARGSIADVAVTAVTCEPFGVVGWSTRLARLTLTYDRANAQAPATLITKFSAPDPSTRQFFKRFYEREVFFYETLAARVPPRVPYCYYADYDPLTCAHVLLLEDLAPARAGDIWSGVGVDAAREYIELIAGLHATWWDAPELDTLLLRYPAPGATFARGYSERFEPGLRVMRPYLDRTTCELAGRIQASLQERWARHSLAPRTLIHWDAHAANVTLPSIDGGAFAVLDWQNWTVARGMWDVCRFCILSLPIAERRSAESALIEHYTKTLAELGVPAYPIDRAMTDYLDMMPLQFAQQLRFFGGMHHWNDERRSWVAAITPRVAAALHDAADGGGLD